MKIKKIIGYGGGVARGLTTEGVWVSMRGPAWMGIDIFMNKDHDRLMDVRVPDWTGKNYERRCNWEYVGDVNINVQ